jgi:fluoride ion exporter CrcB/FEX
MRQLVSIVCVGFGGGFGDLARRVSMETLQVAGLPEYAALLVVNVCGCFLIGIGFIWLEASLRRAGASRLRQLPVAASHARRPWWPEGDPTLPVVDQFRRVRNLQLLAAVVITGFLGTLTTFSSFSLLSVQLFSEAAWLELACNVIGSLGLGVLAVWFGLTLGRFFVFR